MLATGAQETHEILFTPLPGKLFVRMWANAFQRMASIAGQDELSRRGAANGETQQHNSWFEPQNVTEN